MSRIVLKGVNGADPLGFMASVGLLRIASQKFQSAALGFLDDGSHHPFIEGVDQPLDELVADDAKGAEGEQPWRLRYGKAEKKGTKFVEDLKPSPDEFVEFANQALTQWQNGLAEGADYTAAYAASSVQDEKGNTKPTAFHFTAGQQEFLKTIELIRLGVELEWCREALLVGSATRRGANVRWDPSSNRNYALMAQDPTTDGTSVVSPIEWLAFRSLPAFPAMPRGTRLVTTCVSGVGKQTTFTWPLWSLPTCFTAVRSLLGLSWRHGPGAHRTRGVFSVCDASILRAGKGYGNFAPASIRT